MTSGFGFGFTFAFPFPGKSNTGGVKTYYLADSQPKGVEMTKGSNRTENGDLNGFCFVSALFWLSFLSLVFEEIPKFSYSWVVQLKYSKRAYLRDCKRERSY